MLDYFADPHQIPDVVPAVRSSRSVAARRRRGARSYHSGLSAEATVEKHYCAKGATCLGHRWRGTAGEIDLVFRTSEGIVFVEVKQARTFDQAAQSLTARQQARIFQTGEEFLATQPMGALTPSRFDVALVDGQGSLQVLENALMAW